MDPQVLVGTTRKKEIFRKNECRRYQFSPFILFTLGVPANPDPAQLRKNGKDICTLTCGLLVCLIGFHCEPCLPSEGGRRTLRSLRLKNINRRARQVPRNGREDENM